MHCLFDRFSTLDRLSHEEIAVIDLRLRPVPTDAFIILPEMVRTNLSAMVHNNRANG
jgi:ribosomal silencing factor RsfS